MNLKEILNDLSMAVAILSEAKKTGKLSDLERDLVLDILKRNYSAVRFGVIDAPQNDEKPLDEAKSVTAVECAKSLPEEKIEEPTVKQSPEMFPEAVASAEVEFDSPEEEIAPAPEATQVEIALPVSNDESATSTEEVSIPVIEEKIESADEESVLAENVEDPAPAAEPTEEISAPAAEPAESEFHTSVRHKIDRQTIRSLYGDDMPSTAERDDEFYPISLEEPAPAPAEEPTPSAEIPAEEEEPAKPLFTIVDTEEDVKEYEEEELSTAPIDMELLDRGITEEEFEPHGIFESDTQDYNVPEEFVEEQPVADITQTVGDSAPHLTVLGDVVGDGHAVLGESIGAPHADVASVLGAEKVATLRGAIGLNDRFLLIRDLFGGDGSAYDRAITALDECSSLDEAMLYIVDNFEWDAESDGAKLLSDLIVRRFDPIHRV